MKRLINPNNTWFFALLIYLIIFILVGDNKMIKLTNFDLIEIINTNTYIKSTTIASIFLLFIYLLKD